VQFLSAESDDVHVGVEVPEIKGVVDLNRALKKPRLTMIAFLELGNEGLRKAKALAEAAGRAKKFTKNSVTAGIRDIEGPYY